MRIGLIGRADKTGLGYMTADFCRGVDVVKAAIIERTNRGPTDSRMIDCPDTWICNDLEWDLSYKEWLADGEIDVLVAFETYYNHDIAPYCEREGIRTVLFPMVECTPPGMAEFSSVVFNLSDLAQVRFPFGIQTDWPIHRDDFMPQRVLRPPKNFVCNHGHGGLNNRNNLQAVIDSACGVSIRTQSQTHERATYLPAVDARPKLYRGVDVLVHLQAFGCLSLPLAEAAACRVPCVVMDVPGFERYPEQMRVRVDHYDSYEMAGFPMYFGRPNLDHLREVLRGLESGEIVAESCARPPSWLSFAEIFEEALSCAVH